MKVEPQLTAEHSPVHKLPGCRAFPSRAMSQLRSAHRAASGLRWCGPTFNTWLKCKTRCHASAAEAEQQSRPTAQEPAPARRKRILSGVQPTGSLHIGNYLGAIRNWVTLQDLYDTYFCVVDMHAITLPHDPKELQDASRRSAAVYLACGIDPERSSIFIQSHVPAHAELAWLLSCVTPIGWLRRMTQFKEKSKSQGEEVGTGLLTYPVLMAADILLYQADLVPVGEDQMAHIELTRDIAERVNKRKAAVLALKAGDPIHNKVLNEGSIQPGKRYGGNKWKKLGGRGGRIFRIPEVFIPPAGARVMSLTDGSSKMSKSAESDLSRINLLDDPKSITNKMKRAKTDAFEGLEFDNPERPEARNLLTIYQLMTGYSRESVTKEVEGMNWGAFKPILAEATIAHLHPIQTRYNEVMADPAILDQVLADGADVANEVATKTLEDCREAMGFTKRMVYQH